MIIKSICSYYIASTLNVSVLQILVLWLYYLFIGFLNPACDKYFIPSHSISVPKFLSEISSFHQIGTSIVVHGMLIL